MAEIVAYRGQVIKVDKEDLKELKKYNWYIGSPGYAVGHVNKKLISMHRLLLGAISGEKVDHKNRVKTDNRKANLRKCTTSQNAMNKVSTSGKSKYKGVHFNKYHNKWRSNIRLNHKRILLGYFDDEESAALEYNKAAKKYFGEFALLNVIDEHSQ